MRKKSILFFVLLICVMSLLFAAEEKEKGPFGTKWLMTKEELAEIGAFGEILTSNDYCTIYDFYPRKTHSSFESYSVVLGNNEGLVKVIAYGNDISCNEYGTSLKTEYGSMKDSLTNSYGAVTNEYDFNTSSLWSNAEDWMYALYKEYRYLACFWKQPNVTIGLEALALSSSKGYIKLTYEHKMWETEFAGALQPVDRRKAGHATEINLPV